MAWQTRVCNFTALHPRLHSGIHQPMKLAAGLTWDTLYCYHGNCSKNGCRMHDTVPLSRLAPWYVLITAHDNTARIPPNYAPCHLHATAVPCLICGVIGNILGMCPSTGYNCIEMAWTTDAINTLQHWHGVLSRVLSCGNYMKNIHMEHWMVHLWWNHNDASVMELQMVDVWWNHNNASVMEARMVELCWKPGWCILDESADGGSVVKLQWCIPDGSMDGRDRNCSNWAKLSRECHPQTSWAGAVVQSFRPIGDTHITRLYDSCDWDWVREHAKISFKVLWTVLHFVIFQTHSF